MGPERFNTDMSKGTSLREASETTETNETTEPVTNSNGKSYADGEHKTVTMTGKSAEELALETAHAELMATARFCKKMTGRNQTRANREDIGMSAAEALANYFATYTAFENSVK